MANKLGEWLQIDAHPFPKDGRFLAFIDAEIGAGSLVYARWAKQDGSPAMLADWNGREWYRTNCFTHWFELPPLPEAPTHTAKAQEA